jgi:hypothetical protein
MVPRSNRCRWPRRVMAVVIVAATLMGQSAGFATIQISCMDGGTGVMRGFGKRLKAPDVCDIDHHCDGVCTFALNPPCERCDLRPTRACSEPGQCGADVGPPCASEKARIAVLARSDRATKTVWPNRRHPRYTLRCLPARCSTTTTTIPDSQPNLTGNWTVTVNPVTDTCPAGVGRRLDSAPIEQLGVIQDGSTIGVCALPVVAQSIGMMSPSGFTVDSGPCCSVAADDGSIYGFSQIVSGSLPDSTGVVTLAIRWELDREGNSGPPGDPATCEKTVSGTMVPIRPSCTTHSDCIQVDPCGRCVDGHCTFDPLCR